MTQAKLKSKSIKWINSKIRYFAEELNEWNRFKQFECSSFFRGYELAILNEELYEQSIKYPKRKIRQLYLLRENKEDEQ